MKKILITGGTGQLGFELQKFFSKKSDYEIIAPSSTELDFSIEDQIDDFMSEHKPDYIIHGGALTNVDKCELEPELAYKTNSDSCKYLSKYLTKHNLKHLVYISTDFVFDGHSAVPYIETDVAQPINIYGKSKLQGEKNLQGYTNASILRVSWVYGGPNSSFINWVLNNHDNEDFTVNEESTSVPTSSKTISLAVSKVLEQSTFGLFHLTHSGSCTRREMAAYILGKHKEEIKPNDQIPNRVAKRPEYSVMKNEKLEKQIAVDLGTWQEALSEHMEEYYA